MTSSDRDAGLIGAETPLAALTTMRVGGPAERIVIANTRDELVAHAIELWNTGEPWLLLGGGSNTVIHDDGYPGAVLLVRTSGIAEVPDATLAAGQVRLRVQAGHGWDELVAETVVRGWSGIEALSGIPGLAGAAPVQNIGAYGQELSDVLHSIEFLDAGTHEVRELSAAELELGYRDSVIKRGLEGVVLTIDLILSVAGEHSGETAPPRGRHGTHDESETGSASAAAASAPVQYGQLATALGVELGARVSIQQLRDSVLRLRAAKGMVLNAADHDTWSSGSFFTNPIVTARFASTLPDDAPRFHVAVVEYPDTIISLDDFAAGVPLQLPVTTNDRMVKLSAAWLIDHAGVPKGYRLPGSGAAVSSKHTLAITNRGGASAADVAELARFIVQRVQQEFGVILVPEPNLYGLEL